MKLHEILSRDNTYQIVRATPGSFRTQKDVGDHTLVFVATLDEDSDNLWQVAFFNKLPDMLSAEPTGDFKSLEVLSFVGSSLEEFISRYAPSVIVYSIAKDEYGEKRDAVYGRVFKKFAPDYTRLKQTGDAGADKYISYVHKSFEN